LFTPLFRDLFSPPWIPPRPADFFSSEHHSINISSFYNTDSPFCKPAVCSHFSDRPSQLPCPFSLRALSEKKIGPSPSTEDSVSFPWEILKVPSLLFDRFFPPFRTPLFPLPPAVNRLCPPVSETVRSLSSFPAWVLPFFVTSYIPFPRRPPDLPALRSFSPLRRLTFAEASQPFPVAQCLPLTLI